MNQKNHHGFGESMMAFGTGSCVYFIIRRRKAFNNPQTEDVAF